MNTVRELKAQGRAAAEADFDRTLACSPARHGFTRKSDAGLAYTQTYAELEKRDQWSTLRALRKHGGRRQRAENRENSIGILRDRGISFVERNRGVHLIVSHNGLVADFWPSTGKYFVRGTGGYKRGVFNLLRDLNHKEQEET